MIKEYQLIPRSEWYAVNHVIKSRDVAMQLQQQCAIVFVLIRHTATAAVCMLCVYCGLNYGVAPLCKEKSGRTWRPAIDKYIDL